MLYIASQRKLEWRRLIRVLPYRECLWRQLQRGWWIDHYWEPLRSRHLRVHCCSHHFQPLHKHHHRSCVSKPYSSSLVPLIDLFMIATRAAQTPTRAYVAAMSSLSAWVHIQIAQAVVPSSDVFCFSAATMETRFGSTPDSLQEMGLNRSLVFGHALNCDDILIRNSLCIDLSWNMIPYEVTTWSWWADKPASKETDAKPYTPSLAIALTIDVITLAVEVVQHKWMVQRWRGTRHRFMSLSLSWNDVVPCQLQTKGIYYLAVWQGYC